MLGPSIIFGGVPVAFGFSMYATNRESNCTLSVTAFRAARLELIGWFIALALLLVKYLNSGPIRARDHQTVTPTISAVVENLTIGKMAPEITGEDIDGRLMKLSDYRGKVVVLEFWGHW